MGRARNIVYDSDDDCPEAEAAAEVVPEKKKTTAQLKDGKALKDQTIRRRKLAREDDDSLLRPWNEKEAAREAVVEPPSPSRRWPPCRGPRVELRTRRRKSILRSSSDNEEECSEEEVTILEDLDEDDVSEFHGESSEAEDNDASSAGDVTEDSIIDFLISQPTATPRHIKTKGWPSLSKHEQSSAPGSKDATGASSNTPGPTRPSRKAAGPGKEGATSEEDASAIFYSAEEDLADPFSRLHLEPRSDSVGGEMDEKPGPSGTTTTPPATPPRKKKRGRLVSPTKKLPSIPITPHRPETDVFWSQEFIDDWNTEHSPRKLFEPPPPPAPPMPPKQKAAPRTPAQRQAKKCFEQAKHAMAAKFLGELDQTITGGRLRELAATAGGITIRWSNKLNTTAGRAHWRRETVRTRPADGGGVAAAATMARYLHHASIELAEKVIDDEDRLLNVLAHEFCHLANFMISGVTGQPHGKEFKAWAAKCSRSFGHRGIKVTTKHSYEIDFKYVWECTACAMQYKRHSKSIVVERHRCGSCKGTLRQTKPEVRRTGATSEYQKFLKEQMGVVKKENPGSPQKQIMRLVADRWARNHSEKQDTVAKIPEPSGVDQITAQVIDLTWD